MRAFDQEGSCLLEVELQGFRRPFPQGHQPFLAPFSQHHQVARLEMQLPELELSQFTHPQAGGIEQFQHGPVPFPQALRTIRLLQQGFHLPPESTLGRDWPVLGKATRTAGFWRMAPSSSRCLQKERKAAIRRALLRSESFPPTFFR